MFKDILGQTFKEGDRFMLQEWNHKDGRNIARYGVISKIEEGSYTLLFDEGQGSKLGSKRIHKTDLLINYQVIKDTYPERFL